LVDVCFVLTCRECTSCQKMNQHFVFLIQVLHDMLKKSMGILWAQCKYCNIEQKNSAYCQIVWRYCKLSPKDPMHILWLSCKYCKYNHITHVIYYSYVYIALKTLSLFKFYKVNQ
jgi:hypothetical protein